MEYSDAVAYISGLKKRGWRLGLDRMQEFLCRIREPQLRCGKFIHVAGTNGKGSTTAMIQNALAAQGKNTGGFFSPYVVDLRERIQLNGEWISESDFSRLTEDLIPFSEALAETESGGPTEFEFKTAMGFLYWKERECEFVALETGLGGRLDSTNVVTPCVSVITEIGLDHQQYLGETIEEIAGEKAGIIKAGAPVVCLATELRAQRVIRDKCRELGVSCWTIGEEINIEFAEQSFWVRTPAFDLRMPLLRLEGEFQRRNAAAAITAVHLSNPDGDLVRASDGISTTALPGRLERLKSGLLFDGAHNASAAGALARELRGRRVDIVFSAASGHRAEETLHALKPIAGTFYIAPMRHERTLSFEALQSAAEAAGVPFRMFESVSDALEDAASISPTTVLVTGSFYLYAEAAAYTP